MKRFLTIFHALRFFESLQISGFFLIGYLFAFVNYDIKEFLLFFAGCFALVFSFYAHNSFSGYPEDLHNGRLGNIRILPRASFMVVSLAAFIAVLVLFSSNYKLLLFSVAIYFAGVIYSIRGGTKYRPVLGTLTHIVVEIFQFNLAYVYLFNTVTSTSILVSLYFGILFGAGHIHHEIIDHEPDKLMKIKNLVSLIGVTAAARLCFGCFFLGIIYLSGLYWLSYIESIAFYPFLIAGIIHLIVWTATSQRKGILSEASLHRRIYRLLYFCAGLAYFFMRIARDFLI
jgi:4-hydroxybenzoate polyprenyltransferase